MPSGDSINAASYAFDVYLYPYHWEQGVCPIRLVVVLMALTHPLVPNAARPGGILFPILALGSRDIFPLLYFIVITENQTSQVARLERDCKLSNIAGVTFSYYLVKHDPDHQIQGIQRRNKNWMNST